MHRPAFDALLSKRPTYVEVLRATWDDFDHASEYHGLWHTHRVMFHVLLLGHTGGLDPALVRRAYCAAVIHDQARTHDGWCEHHGAWAVESKLPRWTERFLQVGVGDDELELIADAVEFHSKVDLPKDHRAYATMALLKDADALDRYRLGPNDLDTRYLRHTHAPAFAPFAKWLVANHWEVGDMAHLFERIPQYNVEH